ncbi:hypothetical protein J2Y69_000952 [Microbacterium resistens]|uniref:GerMN domain-containing protein n=1 Tax=Microbacterium resistens TaxID=156977 RepID=A0ABU1S9S8_9MICO|nr:LpqB family beta-propeller domain-containing protein [Microbacterium resistens]MDR6866360.1 hypothetical protein [Microbacterium resistens]
MPRILRLAVVLVTVLGLAACASLPTTGDVRPGNSPDRSGTDSQVTYVPAGPADDADPEQIVSGFLEAASSPADNWAIARQFLTTQAAEKWRPQTGVIIDSTQAERRVTEQIPDTDDERTVRLGFRQTAGVDENGVYAPVSGGTGTAELTYGLAKNDKGQWRITAAPDGILLAEQSFADADVLSPYALEYFDPTWTYLVPDVRWFPKRKNTATRIVQALVSGQPSPWLADAVRTAFAGDVELERDSVTVTSQIAEVELSAAALRADPVTLSRMRTQLERSLAPLGVLEVRLTVGGRVVETTAAAHASTAPDARPLVLTDNGFGHLSGGELVPVDGLSQQIADFPLPITSIVAGDGGQHAVVQDASGSVYLIDESRRDALDQRPGLIAPSYDPYGYVWTAVGTDPQSVSAWSPGVVPHGLPAFADASAIGAMSVSRDGARVAAAVTIGSQQRVVVAGVSRDDRGTPTAIGTPTTIGVLPGTPLALAWLDDTKIGVLVDIGGDVVLVTQPVGGPSTKTDVPNTVRTLSPMTPASTLRLLGSDGNLWVQSGPTWRVETGGVQVLATQISAF